MGPEPVDPRSGGAMTHRGLAGLASHPVARELLPTGRIDTPKRNPAATRDAAPRPVIETCRERSDRGGSIGQCGALRHAGQPCPRRGTHVEPPAAPAAPAAAP